MKDKDWLNERLKWYVKPATKFSTHKKYKRQIEIHILPALGEYELHELTATVLQRFTVDLSEKGLSANTVNGIMSVLKSSLKRAVALDIAEKEYTNCIVRPKQRKKQVECFSKDEQRKIEQYIYEKKKTKLFGILLCLYTGLQNTYFNERFGRSDFKPVEDRRMLGEAVAYLTKYMEKTGEKIVYSKGLPQYFISDILDEDVVCTIGQEDRKLLLYDNFNCWDEGCLIGPVSKEVIEQMRKSN